ncbi:MAG: heavy metal sensor histidine kinase [Zoogloeaceae bacterium]|nr:heavy metal sensor histidine kinase [Zoogloeaceae bacterium]
MRLMPGISLTARLTLLFATGSSVVLLALGWLIGMSIEHHFAQQDLHTLHGKLVLAQNIIERVDSAEALESARGQLSDALVGHHDLVMKVIGPKQEVLLASPEASFPEAWLAATASHADAHLTVWSQHGRTYRGMAAAIPTQLADWPPVVVAVAVDIDHHEAFMTSFRLTLWRFVAGAALLTGLLGWLAASRGLAPLRRMRERAETVSAQNLDRRLPTDAVPPELADLANTLNEMLDRLEEAFHRLSDFSSDIAHELRTPISNLMMQTQVSLSHARDADAYREILESNAEEFERLARMISDMLFLAKTENGLDGAALAQGETVDLAHEVSDLFEFYEALADEKGVRLELHGAGSVPGDQLMLRRALSNLISNALRYTPSGASVSVSIAADPAQNQIVLEIDNPGATIPAEHLPNLFERFYRTDPSRQHAGGEGTGLGLAITRAIVAAHGGEITVHSANGHTSFRLRLPAA